MPVLSVMGGVAARWACLAVALAGLLFAPRGALAAQPGQATSSRAAREEAIHSLPLDKLDLDTQSKVKTVLGHTTIYRRLPVQVTDCDPKMYQFLVTHPEVIVDIWDVMGISKCALNRIGKDTFKANDGAGSSGTVKILYSNHDTQLIYADGLYEGPMFEPREIKARCVLLLKSGFVQETNGRSYVTSRLDAFIQIDHVGLDLLAKTFQPLITQSADYNFTETTAFLGNVSRTAELNPAGLARLSAKLNHVDADTKEKFNEVGAAVAEKPASTKRVAQTKPAPLKKK